MTNSYSHKAAAEKLDYRCSFATWLAGMPGDAPSSVTININPTGLVIDQAPVADPHPTVWLSGGIRGVEYTIVWTMTTTGGRTKQVNVSLVVT